MKINRKLNLVIPVDRGDEGTIYVHSTPISREVFERYFLVISKTFAAIYTEGLGIAAGPRVASLLLRKVAEDMGGTDERARAAAWEDVQNGLMAEIKRLTNVVVSGHGGWTTLPFQEAVDRKMLDPDDASEVENALAFFTVASAMHKKSELPTILTGAASLWGGQIVSSNSTEFAASLPISTPDGNSGAKATPS